MRKRKCQRGQSKWRGLFRSQLIRTKFLKRNHSQSALSRTFLKIWSKLTLKSMNFSNQNMFQVSVSDQASWIDLTTQGATCPQNLGQDQDPTIHSTISKATAKGMTLNQESQAWILPRAGPNLTLRDQLQDVFLLIPKFRQGKRIKALERSKPQASSGSNRSLWWLRTFQTSTAFLNRK